MPRNTFFVFRFLLLFFLIRPQAFAVSPIQERADRFLALANAGYQALYRVNSEAQWFAVTDVTPQHDAAVEASSPTRAGSSPRTTNSATDITLRPIRVRKCLIRKHDFLETLTAVRQ